MTPIYVSFYTTNGYELEAAELIKTLDAHGLPHDVHGIPAFKNWQRATQYKAEFMRGMLRKHRGRPLVWTDADSRILRPPTLFDELHQYDFAAHWLAGEELLSGTFYLGATVAAERLVDAWMARNVQNPNGQHGDQRNLQDVVQDAQAAKAMRVRALPPAYCFIFDTSKDLYPGCEPVVLHLQASRHRKTY